MCRQPKLKPGKVFNCVARPASIFLATALFASARGALFASTWKYLWVHSMRGGALVVTGVNRGSPRRNLWQYPDILTQSGQFFTRWRRGWFWLWWQWLELFTILEKNVSIMWSGVTLTSMNDATKASERWHKGELSAGEWVSGCWAHFNQRCSDKCTMIITWQANTV